MKTLPSGLQYKVIRQGTRRKPKDTDFVRTKYRGTSILGKELDSSDKSGGSVSFPVNGVIKGWSEALKLMAVGSHWEIYVPPDLAYGDEGAGTDIAPGETLIFDIELLSINPSRVLKKVEESSFVPSKQSNGPLKTIKQVQKEYRESHHIQP